MSVTNMMGRLDMAEKLSIPQLRVAIQNGSLPAYIGIPLLQNKIQMRKRLDQAKNIREQATTPVAQQVMQESSQYAGIDSLPSGLPLQAPQGMAEGGIVALQAGGGTGEQTRRINPRTNLPYTDAEMAAFKAREDSWSKPGPLGQAWDGITRVMGGKDYDSMTPEERSAQLRSDRAGLAAPGAALSDVLIGGPYNALADAVSWAADSRLGRALGVAGLQPPKIGTGTATPFYDKYVRGIGQEDAPTTAQKAAPSTEDKKQPPVVDDKKKTDVEDKKQTAPPPGLRQRTPPSDAGIAALSGSQAAVAPETPADVERERPRSALDQYVDMLMKEREGAATSREEAKNMALIQAGLAIMAGKSPNALANIGEGAQRGLATYAGLQKEVDEAEANRLKQLVSIAGVKEQLARDDRKLGLTEQQLAQQMEIAQLQANTRLAAAARRGSGGAGVGGKPMTQAQFVTAVQKASDAILQANPTLTKEAADKLAVQQVRDTLAAMYGGKLQENNDPNEVDFLQLFGGDE